VREAVTSPTFTVAHRYAGPTPVSHLDLYRSRGVTVEELADLEPYLEPDAVVFVEWPAAGSARCRSPTWVVDLDHAGGDARAVSVRRAVPEVGGTPTETVERPRTTPG
jgi:tRNA threonylcarbamoyladenosine biosynthesis protein TsaE